MLEVKELCGSIGDISVEGVSLLVEEGDFLGIFGPDDGGKTELLLFVMGLAPASGEVLYQGDPIIRKGVGAIRYVPDSVLMEQGLTALKYLKQTSKAYKIQDPAKAEELAAYFEVDLSERLVDMTYEGNKLVTIIAALLTEPDLLILDEPFNFLTKEASEKLMELLSKKNQEGMTILITAEKYQLLKGYVNKYLYLKEGKVVAQGSVDAALENMRAIRLLWEKTPLEYREAVEEVLGEPACEKAQETIYLCKTMEGKLARLVSQCGVHEDDILIERVELEEVLETEGKKNNKSENR